MNVTCGERLRGSVQLFPSTCVGYGDEEAACVRTIPIPTRAFRGPIESKRLLALAPDERLVARIRRGSDVAFEVAFERHGPGVLSFCRHMLGSREEAEDAVQHTFAAAYRALH